MGWLVFFSRLLAIHLREEGELGGDTACVDSGTKVPNIAPKVPGESLYL